MTAASEPRAGERTGLPRSELVWSLGRIWIGVPTRLLTRARAYGTERIPAEGGLVIAANHFSWLDPPLIGALCPRQITYVAKVEAHRVPGLGQLIRAHGTLSIRRGESDREAVRLMRLAASEGRAVGLFVEGTRQRAGVPGKAQPGAAMIAIQEGVPVLPVAVEGTQRWSLRNRGPCSVAWGEPVRFEGLPRGGRGYREASLEIERRIHRLWEWLVELHAQGRPRTATPPV